MRALVQRVARAEVGVGEETVCRIRSGVCALIGVRDGDDEGGSRYLAEKIAHLRVFPDDEGRMNRSLLDIGGEALVVSQFTLYADTRRGRRPSFVEAARPEEAEPLVRAVAEHLRGLGVPVAEGVFGASMDVSLTNAGPVTILIDSP